MNHKPNSNETVGGPKPFLKPSKDLIGKQFGDYKIIKEIGRGGMAIVYEAHQISLNRPVAIKVIAQALIEEQAYLERFKREASSAANLSHQNIVSIHGFGKFDDTYYYVMDLARGKTLDNLIEEKKQSLLHSRQRFNAEEALDIIEQAASALSYAHSQGIVHRDIKSSNIFVDSTTGRVLVTDFGLAKSIHWEKITPRASLFGTPAYMSPEQTQGKELDHRTDIYSLGAVLYEMLTGTEPYKGENALEVIEKVKTEPILPPRKINPAIPASVESIILKAMSKDIWMRYQKMDELLKDIQRFRSGRKITTFIRIAESKVAQRELSRKNIFLFILTTFISIAIIFVIAAYWQYEKKRQKTKTIIQQLELAENYELLGMKEMARHEYMKIIESYPDSKYSGTAKNKLGKLGTTP